jgi:hypothetical protein
MRLGSFIVEKDDQKADVSIIPLAGISGSELDNVNRWRGQVGLEPLDAAQLAAAAEPVQIGSAAAALYDFAGTDPKTKQPARLLASILPEKGTTWFFKMSGSDALVAQEKPAFKDWLKSIQLQAGAAARAPTGDPVAEAHRNLGTMKDMGILPGHEDVSAEKPQWNVPPGWQERPPSSMRLGTFLVTGEGGAKADVSVIKLAGDAGGVMANVNRWRFQLGLEPVDEDGLEKLISERQVNGAKVILVELAGKEEESGRAARMLAAIVPRSGTTWFYKMVGDDQFVASQKDAFMKFVETARYPNAS